VNSDWLQHLSATGAIKNPELLAKEVEQKIGVTELQRLRALPDTALDRLFEAGMHSIGCGK
jgi:hypothetical protein